MRIELVTLFPEFFDGPLSSGLLGKAVTSARVRIGIVDPRGFATDRHHRVDDSPYGGGAGMVMKAGPVVAAIEAADGGRVVMLTPQGKPLAQPDLERWSREPRLVLVCGRYEGFDERVRSFVHEEISLGDFVLTGGEYGAMVIVDGVVRLLEGTLGNAASIHSDSFSDGLLEHAQYTRPESFRGMHVPAELLTGDHARIAALRRREALSKTVCKRPDLIARRVNRASEREVFRAVAREAPAVSIALRADDVGAVVDLVLAYGLGAAYVVGVDDLSARLGALPAPREPPREGSRKAFQKALEGHQRELSAWNAARARVVSMRSFEDAAREAKAREPELVVIVEGARSDEDARSSIPEAWIGGHPSLLVVGASGAISRGPVQDSALVARMRAPVADRSPLIAAAVLLDRLLGER